MRKIEVNVAQELSDAIQSRQLELEGYKHLLLVAYSSTDPKIPEERIQELENKYIRIDYEYNLLKQEIENIVVPVDYDKSKTSWSLDFNTKVVTVIEA